MKILFVFITFISTLYSNTLQKSIDQAPAGSIIKLQNGTYIGRLNINKPISIIGLGKDVIIKGDGTKDVITITSSNVTLKNIIIKNSGNRIENLDSAVLIKEVKNCLIKNCTILDSLYGINMMMVDNSKFIGNYITSKDNDISLKGDAFKIWYCKNNIIENNMIKYSRDTTLTYSHNNKLINNTFINNRYGTQISLSKNNIIVNNLYKYNSVGLILMGAKDTKVIKNQILSSKGAAGMGIVTKGGENQTFKDNKISFNTHGFYIDTKEEEEGMQRYIKYNEISFNKEALHFHAAIKNNTIVGNKIFGNIDDVAKDVRGNFTHKNIIEYNYWDRYMGFDKNKDNVGDTVHQNMQYASQLWHYNKKVKFFYGSPIMTIIDFLSQLAPFVQPVVLLVDQKPIVNKNDSF
ncbi:MAG: nitrous oxide reductase family maturation protein NosD [Campylobacteraceae bacterium]|nr:nitrous oxide reductase family maturation protein NosD [Campylobacteraceae bacterium]MBT3882047.1 nitrous oxide reductase family maturation protein NosD [Campylobacteraceae bacterium]MBT4030056.1 nitrous oxide reductase family maturation protein NosD [Campylobacteraceae bacterium]MBT4179585.1 nitrous oxide reductase family maturation protein NosD [Campylobacteraceae bacterium]MBT4572815.1 nitrous oxide reductase family maturation protein NosD [Campylobacteraceae bacterium]